MAEDLFHSEDENKLPMGIHFIENAKMRYSWRFTAFKKRHKMVRLGVYIIGNVKDMGMLRLGVYFIENVKIGYC